MLLLFLTSLLWAFSFGLTKQLAGLDGAFISAARLGLALIVFLPFLRLRGLPARARWSFLAIGALEFGLMYLAYNESYRFLKSAEVALFTLTTPILVTLVADALERRLRVQGLVAALLAVAGGACIVFRTALVDGTLQGIALVQLANLAFALGQVLYRRERQRLPGVRDVELFGLLYLGAIAVVLPASLLRTDFTALAPSTTQWAILAYLGMIASGLGFFLWNRGATQVSAGTLAAMNNAKVPLAVAVSLLVFGEQVDLPRLLLGGALLALAVWVAERKPGASHAIDPG
ncbi:MAG: EamA family transporter [Archangium sp.]|nr:EamA family transporter [Archangium sp.]